MSNLMDDRSLFIRQNATNRVGIPSNARHLALFLLAGPDRAAMRKEQRAGKCAAASIPGAVGLLIRFGERTKDLRTIPPGRPPPVSR